MVAAQSASQPSREQLLAESVADKLIRYARVNTQSSEESDQIPSTPGQLRLAEMLRAELCTLGLTDAAIDEFGFVTATLPSPSQPAPGPDNETAAPNGTVHRPGPPIVAFLAHMDTVPGVPAEPVEPMLHARYAGGDLRLPGAMILVAENPALQQVIGHDLITSDGRTLLGADDKAGIAEIMVALCRWIQDPTLPRPTIKVAFTPDEETGRGILHFDVQRFGADVAYTLDGGGIGELEYENFNAANLTVTFSGISTHTGTARGKMINALHLAADFMAAIPAGMRPETTDGRQGFIHPDTVEGRVEEVQLKLIVRDFDAAGLDAKLTLLHELARTLEMRYPGAKVEIRPTGGYQNMKTILDKQPQVVEAALQAIRAAGLEPKVVPIRGGTDGAHLTYAGLPTPNLFTGGMNYHSRTEWVSVQWMEKAVETILQLGKWWARQPQLPPSAM
ncbi:MAG: peptidase T [Firmicutes bacterium]|nr:peptidase T [Bacillota bacterium]